MASFEDTEERLKAALADRYRIEREIGSGGMGTVYLAQDLRHERQVAVKVLDPDLAQTLGPERFLREIKTAANLTHPHILPVHDSGEADGFLFYVMPYVKGESLRTRLTKEKQLPVEDAIQITREIADALAYAHEEGVIHRDVKPANIMLEAGHAVLADFGVAHAVAEAGDDRITRTGTSLGTPAYMSPEQASGESDLDGRTDQYALGCVLYEMLAGHPPFTGAQVETVVRQHLTEEPPSVTQARPSVADEVASVISRALCKSPADRFKTTGEMAAALALTTVPVRQKRRRLSRPLRIAAGVFALVVISVLAIVAFWPERGPTRQAPGTGPDARPSIAVLPFQNRSGLEEDAYFTDGMHDQIITQLTKISGLSVRGLTSVLVYRDRPKNLREIGEELNARYIVEGGVQRAGGTVRISIQLIEAATDEHLWADSYDRTISVENLLSIQTEIVEVVADSVRAAVTPEELARIESRPTDNLDAYNAYVTGRVWLSRASTFVMEAIPHFEEAIQHDSTFGLAHAGLAESLALVPWLATDSAETLALVPGGGEEEVIPFGEAHHRALAAVERALHIDDRSGEAHNALAMIKMVFEWNWEEAEREFQTAIELSPNYARTHSVYAWLLAALGRFDDAVREARIAVELDPLSAHAGRNLGNVLTYGGRFDEAVSQLQATLAIHPDNPAVAQALAHAYLGAGRYEEAVEVLPHSAIAAAALYRLGRKSEALELAEPHFDEASRTGYRMHLAVEDVDGALAVLAVLKEAHQQRLVWAQGAHLGPMADPVRSDPRFLDFLRGIGLLR